MQINGVEYFTAGIIIPLDEKRWSETDGRNGDNRLDNYVRQWVKDNKPDCYFTGQFLEKPEFHIVYENDMHHRKIYGNLIVILYMPHGVE